MKLSMFILILLCFDLYASDSFICKSKSTLATRDSSTSVEIQIKLTSNGNGHDLAHLVFYDDGTVERDSDVGLAKKVLKKGVPAHKELFDLALWNLHSGMYQNLKADISAIDKVEIYDYAEALERHKGDYRFYKFYSQGKEVLSINHLDWHVICGQEIILRPYLADDTIGQCDDLEESEDYLAISMCIDAQYGKHSLFQKL